MNSRTYRDAVVAAVKVEQLLERYAGEPVKRRQTDWDICCPFHGEANPSCSVSLTPEKGFICHACGKKGSIVDLFAEFCGCQGSFNEALTALAEEFGVDPPAPQKARKRTTKRQIAATYDYAGEHGELLYQVVRYDPKDFRQRRPDGNGAWKWSLGTVRRVLFRLPELLAADPTAPVFVTEGEKDVLALVARGQIATCNSGGADDGTGKKWFPAFADALAGRNVVVIEDNDEAGQRHAQHVVRTLVGKARSIKLVTFREMPEHTDVGDWLAAGHVVEELLALAAATPELGPPDRPKTTSTPAPNQSWRSQLTYTQSEFGQRLDKTPGNLGLYLTHEDQWVGCLGFDELQQRSLWLRPPPSIEGSVVPRGPVADEHYVHVQHWFRGQALPTWSIKSVELAVAWAAQARRFSPVVDYLCGLTWDGTPRVDRWLETYFSATVPPTSQVGRWWLISAVARAMKPGCQVDHMLVLEGPQGVGKSTGAGILAGDWFSNEVGDLRDKDAAQSLAGVWIVELSELDAIRRADATRVKKFLTTRSDHFRPSFGRNVVDRPRRCVFLGTTNESTYLQDPSGGRRFWPVTVGALDATALTRDRDQIWAEAKALFDAGERWWPQGEECSALADTVEDRFAIDPWEDPIAAAMENTSTDWTIERILSHVLDVDVARQDRAMSTRVGTILARLGYEPRRRMVLALTKKRGNLDGKPVSETGSAASFDGAWPCPRHVGGSCRLRCG